MAEKQKVGNEIRREICRKYDNGKTISDIGMDLEVKYKTVASIVRVYKDTGRIEKITKRVPKTVKINVDTRNYIKTLISEDASITLGSIKKQLAQNKNLSVSESTIYRAIDAFNYSFKRISLIPERRNCESNILIRREFANTILSKDEDTIVYIDEMGISCSTRCSYGRSEKGMFPYIFVYNLILYMCD